MRAGIGVNGQLIMDLVGENPGKMKKADVIEMFEPKKQKSAAISLGRLLSPLSGKLKEDEKGYIYPADSVVQTETEIQTQNDYLSVPPAFSAPIDIPEVAKTRNMDVVFEIQLRVKRVKRIGLATATHINSIVWLPPGSSILKAKIGNEPQPTDELMSLKYLVIVTRENGQGYFAHFYQPPRGQNFVLAWEEE